MHATLIAQQSLKLKGNHKVITKKESQRQRCAFVDKILKREIQTHWELFTWNNRQFQEFNAIQQIRQQCKFIHAIRFVQSALPRVCHGYVEVQMSHRDIHVMYAVCQLLNWLPCSIGSTYVAVTTIQILT